MIMKAKERGRRRRRRRRRRSLLKRTTAGQTAMVAGFLGWLVGARKCKVNWGCGMRRRRSEGVRDGSEFFGLVL